MRDLDETDLDILRLLVADARRPYSDIAEEVGLSPPAVSDRISRLQEVGIIRRFTVDLDRSQLAEGIPVLLTLDVDGAAGDLSEITESLLNEDAVEHVFTTAAGDLVINARVPDNDVAGWLTATVGDPPVRDLDVTLLANAVWSPTVDGAEFALTCAECGNTVDSEGTATRLDGTVHQFCCPSCEAQFVERYEQHQQAAD